MSTTPLTTIAMVAMATLSVVMAEDDVVQLGANNGDFGVDLYQEITRDGKMIGENIFFSPFSVSAAMAMTYLGAAGDTKAEMGDIMKFSENGEEQEFLTAYQKLLLVINRNDKNYTLDTANKLFASNKYQFKRDFLDATERYFAAALQAMNFAGQPEAARAEINTWVADQTMQKIKDLLPSGSVTGNTIMVLVNAIYFKGLWVEPFKPTNTRDMPFKVSPTVQPDIPMMYMEAYFNYAELDDAQILEIPYEGKDVSMLIVLPNVKNGDNGAKKLSAIEKKLSMETLTSMMSQMHKEKVKLSFPKFKLTQEMSLKTILFKMGIRKAFTSAADFSKLTDGRLAITEVVHKAFIEVNEEGTEAAAATGVVISRMSAIRPTVFKADHPFLFYIHEKTTNSILFMGRLMRPMGADEEPRSLGVFGGELPSVDTSSVSTICGMVSLLLASVIMAVVYHS